MANPGKALLAKLRTAVLTAVWGATRANRCKEIVLTLFVRGHAVDPVQAETYLSLRHLRRRLRARPDLRPHFESAWQLLADGHTPVGCGPVGKVWAAAPRLSPRPPARSCGG